MSKKHSFLVVPLVFLAFGLAGCAAGGGAAPTVSPPPAADDKPCAVSLFDEDAVEVDVSEMPVLGGATLPVPDCLLVSDSDELFLEYQAYYLDTSGAIHDKYEAALLGAGFRGSASDDDWWVKDFVDPSDESFGAGLGVQGQRPDHIRDGDVVSYVIGIPRFCLDGGC